MLPIDNLGLEELDKVLFNWTQLVSLLTSFPKLLPSGHWYWDCCAWLAPMGVVKMLGDP